MISDDLLTALFYTTLALSLLAIIFAIVVFILHFRNTRRQQQFDAIEAEWEPRLLELIIDEPALARAPDIPPGHERHFLNYLVRFARRVRGPEREALKRLAAPMLADIATQLRSRRPEVRARAVQSLGTVGLPDHAEPVLAALDDESEVVAMTAARTLARREHPQYAAAVLARLHRFDDWHPQYLSALLAGIGPDAAPALRATLGDPAVPPRSRAVAAGALTALRDLAAAPIAGSVLRQTQEPVLLEAALQLLSVVGGPDTLPLVRALTMHPLPFVRAEALAVLAHIGERDDVALLEAALDDDSPWVALRAGHALGDLRELDTLRRLAERDDQPGIVAREVLSEERS